MKKIITTGIITLLICSIRTFSIDTTSIKYYPLNVGNIYVYKVVSSGFPPPEITYARVLFTKDSIIYGKRYFYYSYVPNGSNYWCRTDSNSGSLYKFDSGTSCHVNLYDRLIDSLSMRSGGYLCDGAGISCEGETNTIILGVPTIKLTFHLNWGSYSMWWSYAMNFGFVNRSYSAGIYSGSETLIGCLINGILYGDTTIPIGIQCFGNELPVNYSLSQNYPNPFNPVTRIKYQIPLSRGVSEGRGVLVKLIIYDILGREIETLVNETQKPGSYEVEWDGSRYASGVYFYRLITDDPSTSSGQGYVETKKIVLIK